MDIIEGKWLCSEYFKDAVAYHKFLMLCKFAGLKVSSFYETLTAGTFDKEYNQYHTHYPGVGDSGCFDTWESYDWAERSGFTLLSFNEAENLLKKAIKEQVGLGTIDSCPD
jgi:hypothetical protein